MKTKKRLLGIILSGLLTLSPPIQYVSYAENADQTEDIASDGISSSEISYSEQDIKDNEISLAEIENLAAAEAEYEEITATADDGTVYWKNSIPKSLMLYPETAKTMTITRETFDYNDVIKVKKYNGDDANTTAYIENNIYTITNKNPTLSTAKYKYVEIVYYYSPDTQHSAEGEHMQFTIGKVKNMSDGTEPWYGNNYTSEDEIISNTWARQVIDISEFTETYPQYTADGFCFQHVRVRPFGNLKANQLEANDTIYIKAVNLYSYDPRIAKQEYRAEFYSSSEASSQEVGDVTSEIYGMYTVNTLPEYTPDNGTNFIRWYCPQTGKNYYAGESFYFDEGQDIKFYAVTAQKKTAYVSESLQIEGLDENITVHASLDTALNEIGSAGGTIYVSGSTTFSSAFGNNDSDTFEGKVVIKGYNGTEDTLYFPTSGIKIYRDLEFDNIKIKAQNADERWISANNCEVTFDESCAFELSDNYGTEANPRITGLYIGKNYNATGNSKFVLKDPDITYTMLSSVGNYGSSEVANGNFIFDIYGGIFKGTYGVVRNGKSDTVTFQKIIGDVTYNIEGGSFTGGLYTNSLSGGSIDGNVTININGGSFSNIVFGNSQSGFAAKTSAGNVAVIVNTESMEANSSPAGNASISSASDVSSCDIENKILIINNSENTEYIPSISTTAPEYMIKVNSGKAYPVFSDKLINKGELIGFEIISDRYGYIPFIGDYELKLNEYGYYNIPKASNGEFAEISFVNEMSGVYYTVSFSGGDGATGNVPSVQAECYSDIVLPENGYSKDGYLFAGWIRSSDNALYAPGYNLMVQNDETFTAAWMSVTSVEKIYLDGTNGKATNGGGSPAAPLATLADAFSKAMQYGADKIIVTGVTLTETVSLPSNTGRITITSLDSDGTEYEGALIVNKPFTLNGPITFENIQLGCNQYQFIVTKNHEIIFGDGIEKAPGTDGIYAHLGSEISACQSVNTVIKSGTYKALYFGGAYYTSDITAVTNDAVLTVDGAENLSFVLGFDGYTTPTVSYNSEASFGGSVLIKLEEGSISNITKQRISGINGSLYLIYKNGCQIPSNLDLPQAANGTYIIRADNNALVDVAYDSNGIIIPGSISVASPDNSSAYFAEITDSDGTKTIYSCGNIELDPGTYSISVHEGGVLSDVDIAVSEPIPGHRIEKEYIASSLYSAVVEWLPTDGGNTSVFEGGKQYSVNVTLKPGKYTIVSELTASINSLEATVTENADGSYTLTYAYPVLSALNMRYVSASSGSDSYDGMTAESAYQSLSKAVSALSQTGGVITVCDAIQFSGTLPQNSKEILITGEGYPGAEITVGNNASIVFSGDIIFENISFNMGNSSHFNDKGHKVKIGEGTSGTIPIFHVGAIYTGNASPSIDSCDIEIGGDMTVAIAYMGGGYLTNALDGVAGDISLTVDGGKVSNIRLGSDYYLENHTGCTIGGNILVTVNSGSIGSFSSSSKTVAFSDSSVVQVIFNNCGDNIEHKKISTPLGDLKTYTVYSGQGGRVIHAVDDGGQSISGKFDIIPDDGYIAMVIQGSEKIITSGGRYEFNPGETVCVTYIRTDYELEDININLCGGTAVNGMFSIDSTGNITFENAPVKDGEIFEGWYSDSGYTNLLQNGDFVGSKFTLYAKYATVNTSMSANEFTVKGAESVIPQEGEEISQALRYITVIDNDLINLISSFSSLNPQNLVSSETSAAGTGIVAIAAGKLGGNKLVIGGEYEYNGEIYDAVVLPAYNIFAQNSKNKEYDVSLMDIFTDISEETYTVRPYISYYSRSGNLVTAYSEKTNIDIYETCIDLLLQEGSDTTVNDYIRNNICSVLEEKYDIEFISAAKMAEYEAKRANMKQTVLNSENLDISGITGTVYYVSPNGNDDASGTSPENAWKTLAKVSGANLSSGDAVLFERGAEFRGTITGKAGVTYSAYGTGAKPIINGSLKNYADPSLWQETQFENVYVLTETLNNVGIIAFDHSGVIGEYDEIVGTMRVSGVSYDGEVFYNQSQLKNDLEFYSNLSTNQLYVYSAEGNPGERFSSIEIGKKQNLFTPSSDNTVDNLHFVYVGGHAVGGGGGFAEYDSEGNYLGITGCRNLKVTNCIFAWIGGSILSGFNGGDYTRYGNAIEIYGSVDGYLVQNNWIYQIYDTGVTHQISATSVGNTMMREIDYLDNLIEYCHWSIEFYNAPCGEGYSRICKDIYIAGNFIYKGGFGWGSELRRTGATLYNSFGLSNVASETENFHAENNIFCRSAGYIYRLTTNASERNLTFNNNVYIQDLGSGLGYIFGVYYNYDKNAANVISSQYENSVIGETNSSNIYYYLP
jgi:hypothetical protein